MNCYRYLGGHGHVFVGLPIGPTTFPWRAGAMVDAPFGSPVELFPGDNLVTWEKLEHPLLELTDEHPFAVRPRPVRDRTPAPTRNSRPRRTRPEEQ